MNVTPGWFKADKVIGWQSSGIVSQYFEGARPAIILTNDLFEKYCEITEDVLVIVLDPVFAPEPKEPVFVSAEVTWFNRNLQNANNGNLKFTVTVTMSDGSTYDFTHAETVNGGQKGSKTFDYGDYEVSVVWNDNNTVTKCEVK